MDQFEVLPYGIDNLVRLFVDGSQLATKELVLDKRHRVYFEEYFAALGASTIVAEHNYVDRDYLEDHAAYYDRCFQDYSRRTQRLHFFSVAFDSVQFEETLENPTEGIGEQCLREAYLGFVVVKPLPQTIVGRTCLTTYPADGGRRQFPSLRTYPVGLFGLSLEVNSLAYQEQDTVVAACATSALWSCFQGTGKLFQHSIPSPVEITNWAGSHVPEDLLAASARAFPNAGLTCTQMAHAVRHVGLEPVVIGANSRYGLNSITYAYLRGRIPSLLTARLVCDLGSDQPSDRGAHAIALTGFSLGDPVAPALSPTGFLLRGNRIDKIYGHDDQVGPFARMIWEEMSVHSSSDDSSGSGKSIQTLRTSWAGVIHAIPSFVLLPLYHKIRIPFALIHDEMLRLDAVLEEVRRQLFPDQPRVEWDIFLTTANEYKRSVRDDYANSEIDIKSSLLADLPRFLWRATARTGEKLELEFLFDATGIAQQDLLVHAVSTGGTYAQILGALALHAERTSKLLPRQVKAVLKRFLVSPIS